MIHNFVFRDLRSAEYCQFMVSVFDLTLEEAMFFPPVWLLKIEEVFYSDLISTLLSL